MELVGILRTLWHKRVLVAVAALLAVVVGYVLVFHPPTFDGRQYGVGKGTVTALVDTPSSRVVDLGGDTDIASLSARATLLASLVTSSPLKDDIAKRSGLDPRDLIAIAPSGDTVGSGASDGAASAAAPSNADAIVLKARVPTVESGDVPIIAVETQAKDAATAAKLANESISVLQTYLRSVAGTDDVPNARRLVVTQLGPAEGTTVTQGPKPVLGLAAALVVFLLGCATIVGIQALIGGWRRADVMDQFEEDEAFDFDLGDEASESDDEPTSDAQEAHRGQRQDLVAAAPDRKSKRSRRDAVGF